jgi:tRNA nucleotidyltransferase (CCA-adding enzyme)
MLSFLMLKKLKFIIDELIFHNIQPIIVGGFVRDTFLRLNSKDIDIELFNALTLNDVKKILQKFGKVDEVGKSFGVLKMKYKGYDIDFSLPRVEKKVSSGHRGFEVTCMPNIDFKQAASRRDFTINSIGYDIVNEKYLDPFNGIDDINNKRLHYVNEKSFIEDPLRLFRAMQFCARFTLTPSDELKILLKKIVQNDMLKELPMERIFTEFEKLFLKSQKPSIGLNLLDDIGIVKFMPFIQDINKDLDSLQSDNIKLYFALMFITCKDIDSAISFFSNSNKFANDIKTLIRYTLHVMNNTISDIEIQKMTLHVKLDDIDKLLTSLHVKSDFSKRIDELDVRHKSIPAIVNGEDLKALGCKPSKEFKTLLDKCYDLQLKNTNYSKEDILKAFMLLHL